MAERRGMDRVPGDRIDSIRRAMEAMTNTGEALPPGTPLEEFEVERVLGAGGFGLTYLVRDRSLEVHRAVKESFPREAGLRRGAPS